MLIASGPGARLLAFGIPNQKRLKAHGIRAQLQRVRAKTARLGMENQPALVKR
jgi:hypothetical protein